MEQTSRVEFANTLRGFAAIMVLMFHYYGVFWLNRPASAALINAPELSIYKYDVPSYIKYLNYFTHIDYGAFGVGLFFLISGFVIPFSLRNNNGLSFLINRFFRIYPVYFVGFTISLIALYLCGKFFDMPWAVSFREAAIHYFPGLRDVMWSRSIDGIIWTLEIEVKFYLICAAASVLFKRHSALVFTIPLSLAVMSLVLNTQLPQFLASGSRLYTLSLVLMFSTNFIVFMFIGVIFHFAYIGSISERKATAGIAILFYIFVYLWSTGPNGSSAAGAWSYAAALILFAYAYACPYRLSGNIVFRFLANISYPLYVVHPIVGYSILRVLLELGCKAWISLLIATSIAIILAWVIHISVERWSQTVGKSTATWFSVRLAAWRKLSVSQMPSH